VAESNSVIVGLQMEVEALQIEISRLSRETIRLESDKAATMCALSNAKLKVKHSGEKRQLLDSLLVESQLENQRLLLLLEVAERNIAEADIRCRGLEETATSYRDMLEISERSRQIDRDGSSLQSIDTSEYKHLQSLNEESGLLSTIGPTSSISIPISPLPPPHLQSDIPSWSAQAKSKMSVFKSLDERIKEYQQSIGY
jgi:hypothetical protein